MVYSSAIKNCYSKINNQIIDYSLS